MKLNCIIIDDEESGRTVIRRILQTTDAPCTIVGEADNVDDARRVINETNPDLVFLDIRLRDRSAFEILDGTQVRSFDVIFVTAYNEFAIRAIRAAAVDYLLKPVHPEELMTAVQRVYKRRQQHNSQTRERLELILNTLTASAPAPQRLAVPVHDGYRFLDVDSIVRAEADSNYTTLILTSNERLIVSRTLADIEESLPSSLFLRCHQSHLVHLQHVDRYVRGKGGYLVLTDGTTVEVSSRRKEYVLERMVRKG